MILHSVTEAKIGKDTFVIEKASNIINEAIRTFPYKSKTENTIVASARHYSLTRNV